MNKTKIVSIFLAVLIGVGTTVNCLTSGIHYLPDVTREMSSPFFWTNDIDILMSLDEIEKLNEKTVAAEGTNMYDLKNQPEIVDGNKLNEAILKSSQADAEYYLGWTYLECAEKATEEDYAEIIENTQNPDAKNLNCKVKCNTCLFDL